MYIEISAKISEKEMKAILRLVGGMSEIDHQKIGTSKDDLVILDHMYTAISSKFNEN